MPAVYAIDLIAKRDKKIKMDRSIVKGWNVHYQTLEEVEEAARAKKQKEEEEARKEAEKKRGIVQARDPTEKAKKMPIMQKPDHIPGIMEKNRCRTKDKSSRSILFSTKNRNRLSLRCLRLPHKMQTVSRNCGEHAV